MKYTEKSCNTVDFIKQNGIKAIKDLNINVKEYSDYFLLKYNHIASQKTHPIVMECRGLILDYHCNVLRRPFDRFFNYGEGNTQDFDFKGSVCCEKLDGSLIAAWWNPYLNKWSFGTSGTAHAETANSYGVSFEGLIDECFPTISKEEFANKYFDKGKTYLFELCSNKNRIVVYYHHTFIAILAARNNITGEYDRDADEIIKHARAHDIIMRAPYLYQMDDIKNITAYLNSSGIDFEGFVVVDKHGNRIKVKNPKYVALHNIRDNGVLNPKYIATLVFSGETDEYLSYFPEDRPIFQPYIDACSKMLNEINDLLSTLPKTLSQKEYALHVKDKPYAGIMFELKRGSDLETCISKLNEHARLRILESMK